MVDVVVKAQDVNKGYGDRLLIEDLSFDLPPGGIVGVIGPNGAGKTTLFRMIAGQEQPDGGTLKIGQRSFEVMTGGGHSIEQMMLLSRSEEGPTGTSAQLDPSQMDMERGRS